MFRFILFYLFSEPGNEDALEMAKKNLIQHYLLVGVSEKMREFIAALEAVLPNFFAGAVKHFDSLDGIVQVYCFHLNSISFVV